VVNAFLQAESEEEKTPRNSFPANSPRKDLNQHVDDIKRSLDDSLKNIVKAFDESNKRKLMARQSLEKAMHRRVNYQAPPRIL